MIMKKCFALYCMAFFVGFLTPEKNIFAKALTHSNVNYIVSTIQEAGDKLKSLRSDAIKRRKKIEEDMKNNPEMKDPDLKSDGTIGIPEEVEVHSFIKDVLIRNFKGYYFLSEEHTGHTPTATPTTSGTESGDEDEAEKKLYFVCDPCDGTYGYYGIPNSDTYAILLGIAEVTGKTGIPIFGVMHFPAKNETYYGGTAMPGKNKLIAVKENDNDGSQYVRYDVQKREFKKKGPYVMTNFERNSKGMWRNDYYIYEVLRQASCYRGHINTVSSYGAYKFVLVLDANCQAGKADLYPRLIPTKWNLTGYQLLIFDVLPAHAMILANGGVILNGKGEPYSYTIAMTKEEGLIERMDDFMAVGDRKACDDEFYQEVWNEGLLSAIEDEEQLKKEHELSSSPK